MGSAHMDVHTGADLVTAYQEAIPNYIYYEGIPFPGALITKNFSDISSFEVRKDDVLIAGYPRSGNHWVKEIISHLYAEELAELQANKDKHVYERIPILEMAVDMKACMKAYMDKYFEKFGALSPILSKMAATLGLKSNEKFFSKVHFDTMCELANRSSPRLYHTHLPFHLIPEGAKVGGCKIIVVLRNGKDVSSSYYDMHKMYPPFGYYNGQWKEFLHTFVTGKVCFGSWFDHTLGWWGERHNQHVFYVKYEDMIEDLSKEVERIAEFLERPLSAEKCEDIVQRCTFDQMRANPNASYDGVHGAINTSQTSFLRKGKVGDWRTRMTVEDSDLFDVMYEQKKMATEGPNLRFKFS